MTTTATTTPTPTSAACPAWCTDHLGGFEDGWIHRRVVRSLALVQVEVEQHREDERPVVYLAPIDGGIDDGTMCLTDAAQLADALRDAVSIATNGVEHDMWMRMRAAVESA